MDSRNNICKIRSYWQLHMRHEAPSLFRRDTWLQYFFLFTIIYRSILYYLLTRLYLYNLLVVSFLVNLRSPKWPIARTYSYTKLREHYASRAGKRRRWKSNATTTSRLLFIQEDSVLGLVYIVDGRTYLYTSSISSFRNNTRITPSSLRIRNDCPI